MLEVAPGETPTPLLQPSEMEYKLILLFLITLAQDFFLSIFNFSELNTFGVANIIVSKKIVSFLEFTISNFFTMSISNFSDLELLSILNLNYLFMTHNVVPKFSQINL